MILRIFLLACVVISPSFGRMDFKTFSKKFEELCFQNSKEEPFRINGQDNPLSNTLENFIALAEKFEVANPSIDLKAELVYFITEYVFENILFVNGKVGKWTPNRAKMDNIDMLWDPDQVVNQNLVDPFTDDEKCNLYYMISHSLLNKDDQLLQGYSPGNYSSDLDRRYFSEIIPDNYYPQELGVVAILGTTKAVSLSKVLTGLYVGLIPDRKKEATLNEDILDKDKPTDTTVDVLYATTLADVLVQSYWDGSTRKGFAPDGNWVSTKLSDDKSIEGFCPMVYKQEKIENQNLPAYSFSSVRGAADGLILGLSISQIYEKRRESRLSQILRMYYSPDGISLERPVEGTTSVKRVSFCSRQDVLQHAEDKLHDQMLIYGYLIADAWKDVKNVVENADNQYKLHKGEIYSNSQEEIRKYCSRPTTTEKPEDLPRETFLDVIVVMDSSNSEKLFQEQQMIVGYLAKQLDLRHTASRMTILLDHKISSNGVTTSRIELKPVVEDTYSSSCAACMVGQITYEPSSVERDQVIVAIDQFLQERKENETKYSGVNGKVVIYFNYDIDDGRNGNNKIQGSLLKALRNLHLNHQDVTMYAVGLDSELLKKYAKNDPSLVFLGSERTFEQVAQEIYEKISFAPALLQYADCAEAKNEGAATYENFVSPQKIQHYEMPAQYFYKSRSISINFESQNGFIKVCHNRATQRPENEARFCKNTTANTGAEFKISNPCKNLNERTCRPFYFSIMGMDTSPEMRADPRPRSYCDDIKDHWCGNLDQIKYKVSHTGIRCSGCLGLSASTAVMLVTLLLTYFFHKRV